MKRVLSALLVAGLSVSGLALAQQQPQHSHAQQSSPQQSSSQQQGDRNQSESSNKKPPRKGERLSDNRGTRVDDYKSHNLKQPSKGQEWRKVDDKYVLVKIATNVIQKVVDGSH